MRISWDSVATQGASEAAKLRTGIVGSGSISEQKFVCAVGSPLLEVVNHSNRSAGKAREMAARFGVEAVLYEKVLDDDKINLVVNLTPPAASLEVSQRAWGSCNWHADKHGSKN